MSPPLVERGTGDIIPASDHNDVKDYIEDGTYRVNTLSLSIGATEVVSSTLAITNVDSASIAQTTTTGRTLYATRNLASASTDNPVSELSQCNAGDNQNTLNVKQYGTGKSIEAFNNGTNDAIFIDQDGDGSALRIDSEATTEANYAIDVDSAGGAGATRITQNGAAIGVYLHQIGNGIPLSIDNAGAQNVIYSLSQFGPLLTQCSADGTGLYITRNNDSTETYPLVQFKSDHISSTQPTLEVINDGTGIGLNIDQNGNGIALNIDSEATTTKMIQGVQPITSTQDGMFLSHDGDLQFAGLNRGYGGPVADIYRNLASASTSDAVMKIRQDNAGDDQAALTVLQDGTASAIRVNQTGDSSNGALFIENTGTGYSADIRRDTASPSLPLFQLYELNVGSAQAAGNIVNAGTGAGLIIDQNGNTGNANTNAALYVENTGNIDAGLAVYSNIGATSASSLVNFVADNAAFDQPSLSVVNNGTGSVVAQFSDTNGLNVVRLGAGQANTEQRTGYFYRCLTAAATSIPMVEMIQGHVSGDQAVLNLQQNGTGSGILINQDNTGVSSGTGLQINYDGTNTGASVAAFVSTGSSTPGQLIYGEVQNASATTKGISLTNAGTGNGIFLDQNANGTAINIDSEATSCPGINISNAAANTHGMIYGNSDDSATQFYLGRGINSGTGTYSFYRNYAAACTNAPMVYMEQANAGDDQNVLNIIQSGTGVGKGIALTNAGTGNGICIDQNGAATPLVIDSADTTKGDIALTNVRGSDPSSPTEGEIWYNCTDNQFKGYNGTTCVILG